MLKLDNTLLDELGLGSLLEDQKRAMLQHIYETLELRVGTNLANQMTDQQLEEFEKFIDDGGDANQAQALQWLEANLPNYKQVVNEVFEALKLEVKQMAPQLVTASGAVPQAPQQAMPAAAQPAAPTYYDQPATTSYAPAQPPADPYVAPAPQPAAPAPTGFSAPAPQSGYAANPAPADPFAASQTSTPAPGAQMPAAPYAPPQAPQPAQDNTQPPQDYQFPTQQPPAGPGYPPQQ